MIVIALLLLLAAAALVVFVVLTGSQTVLLESTDLNVSWEPTALVVFLLGAVTLLLVVLALGLLRGGTKRKVEQRRELKRLRKVEKENAAAAEPDRRAGAPVGAAAGGSGGTRASHGEHPTSPDQAVTHGQPTRPQPTQDRSTQDRSTQDQPTPGQPAEGQPTRAPQSGGHPTQEQPPIYPRKAGSDQATTGRPTTTQPDGAADSSEQGSWHDEPGDDRPGGRHEAR